MKILGIDYGDARTGLSVSDATGMLAGSPSVIHEWNQGKLLDNSALSSRKTRLKKLYSVTPRIWMALSGNAQKNVKRLPQN